MSNKLMDKRCPRKLLNLPDQWCPLAVQRLRILRYADKPLTEEEESSKPGCDWAINHQMANYCFFKYIADYSADNLLSDVEIAQMMLIPLEEVKKIEQSALAKCKDSNLVTDLQQEYGDEAVIDDSSIDDQTIYD